MNLKRIIASDFLTTAMSSALSIYIYWFAYQYFSNQMMISIIGFGQFCGVFLSSLGGSISDSMNKLAFIKYLKVAKVVLLFLVFSLENVLNMEVLLPLFMFSSTVIGGLLSPSLESLIPFLVENDDDLFRTNSMVSSLTQVASIISVALSAIYISLFSFATVILLTVILSIISVLLLLRISVETPLQSTSVIKNMKQGVAYIFKASYIRNLIPVALVMNFAFWSIFLLLPKIANDNFAFLNISYSGLELAFALGGIIGGVVFAKYFYDFTDKFRLFKGTLFTQSLVLLLLGLMLLLFNEWIAYIGMLFCWFLYALINMLFSIIYFGKLQLKIPKEIIGSVFGAILTIFSLVNPLAAILSGVLASVFEIPTLIILFAMLMLLAAISIRFIPDIETVFE